MYNLNNEFSSVTLNGKGNESKREHTVIKSFNKTNNSKTDINKKINFLWSLI